MKATTYLHIPTSLANTLGVWLIGLHVKQAAGRSDCQKASSEGSPGRIVQVSLIPAGGKTHLTLEMGEAHLFNYVE